MRDGRVSTVIFSKIRNGLGARNGENRFMDPNTPPLILKRSGARSGLLFLNLVGESREDQEREREETKERKRDRK